MFLDTPLRYETGEVFERPVVGAFGIGRKTTGRKLPAVQVISQTITTVVFLVHGS